MPGLSIFGGDKVEFLVTGEVGDQRVTSARRFYGSRTHLTGSAPHPTDLVQCPADPSNRFYPVQFRLFGSSRRIPGRPDSGKEFGADLYGLWRAGKDNLPSVAAQYTIAHVSIARSDSGLTNAFLRPDLFGGGTFGPVYEPWKALRDELEQILRDTGTKL